MKTSTKIFIGAACAAVAVFVVYLVAAQIRHNKCEILARNLARQLAETPIKRVDITVSPKFVRDLGYKDNFSRKGINHRHLELKMPDLKSARVSGFSLYLELRDAHSYAMPVFRSSELETVVVHQAGKPDQLFRYSDGLGQHETE